MKKSKITTTQSSNLKCQSKQQRLKQHLVCYPTNTFNKYIKVSKNIKKKQIKLHYAFIQSFEKNFT